MSKNLLAAFCLVLSFSTFASPFVICEESSVESPYGKVDVRLELFNHAKDSYHGQMALTKNGKFLFAIRQTSFWVWKNAVASTFIPNGKYFEVAKNGTEKEITDVEIKISRMTAPQYGGLVSISLSKVADGEVLNLMTRNCQFQN